MKDTDVLIIGGGMVGVTLALLLSRELGLAITLVESISFPPLEPDAPLPFRPSFDARNTALSRRTVATYRELGLWDDMQLHATPIHEIHVSERGHFGMSRLVAAEERVESFGQCIENAWMGLVLLRALKRCSNVTVHDGVTLTGIRQQATHITAELKKGDEVRLVGFGTFTVARRKASTGRNPRTGEPMKIKASNQPKFKAGKVLKDSVN